MENAAKVTEQVFGKLDILINNAGYLSDFIPIGNSDPEDWGMNWEVNIKGIYLVMKAFLPLILNGSDKTIVNLSSIGTFMLSPGASGYQTAKFAVIRFTEFVNVDYGNQGVPRYIV